MNADYVNNLARLTDIMSNIESTGRIKDVNGIDAVKRNIEAP